MCQVRGREPSLQEFVLLWAARGESGSWRPGKAVEYARAARTPTLPGDLSYTLHLVVVVTRTVVMHWHPLFETSSHEQQYSRSISKGISKGTLVEFLSLPLSNLLRIELNRVAECSRKRQRVHLISKLKT